MTMQTEFGQKGLAFVRVFLICLFSLFSLSAAGGCVGAHAPPGPTRGASDGPPAWFAEYHTEQQNAMVALKSEVTGWHDESTNVNTQDRLIFAIAVGAFLLIILLAMILAYRHSSKRGGQLSMQVNRLLSIVMQLATLQASKAKRQAADEPQSEVMRHAVNLESVTNGER